MFNIRKKLKHWLCCAPLLAAIHFPGLFALNAQTTESASSGVFHDGDRWTVVGDSITQNGTYYEWIYLYYMTRFPAMKLDVANCGTSGDFASGGVSRYPWDIQPRHGTIATVMFGMNDVGRDSYGEANPSPETLARRAHALESYQENLTHLVHLLKDDGARIVLLTPSPFDETAEMDKPRQTGVNEALGACAVFMKKLAGEVGATVVDLHEPMTKLNAEKQANDPRFTLIGQDRIHPASPGHLVITYYFLKSVKAPGLVSEVEIDAATGKTARADNATVSDVSTQDGGVTFKSLENALPFPILGEFRVALNWIPFQDELNREILRVTGLKEGQYTLFIDDQKITDIDSAQLATGVNLATFDSTPQAKQAGKVADLMKKWQKLVANGDRGIAQVEHFMLRDMPHPISYEDAKQKLDAMLTTLNPQKDGYNIAIIKRYLEVKPKEEQTKKDLAQFVDDMRAAAQPQSHSYRLVPANAPPSAAANKEPEPAAVTRPVSSRPDAARIAQIAQWLPEKPRAFCPPATDRAFWDKVSLDRKTIIWKAETAAREPIPELTEALYHEFSKTGRRESYQTPYAKRIERLRDLALGECVEMKGRFIAPLKETLDAILSEPTWVMPAHDSDGTAWQGKPTNVDLGVSGRASTLAAVYQWLGDQLGPEMKERIRSAIRERAIDPYLKQVYENDKPVFFWIKGDNNWNAVCHGSVTYATLATVDDRETRAKVVAAASSYIVNYLNGFPSDGYCSEGLGYWNYGFGHFVLLAESLIAVTNGHINLYNDPVIPSIVSFPLRFELAPNLYPDFSDNPPAVRMDPWILSVLARRYALPEITSATPPHLSELDLTLNPPAVSGAPLPIQSLSPLRGYFPKAGVLVSRPPDPEKGLAVAMKGGNNNENHNHNDIGSYVVAVDGGMIMGDVGGERYTKRTFSAQRYESKVLNSYGHPVPLVNGQLQATGASAQAAVLRADFTDQTDTFALDLTKGYPVAGLGSVKRTFTYDRREFTSLEIVDEMTATAPLSFGTALMTYGKVTPKADGSIEIADGRRAVLVRIDCNGAPWTMKQEVIDEDTMDGRKPVRVGINLNSPTLNARIKCVITPLPSSTSNICIPISAAPQIKTGQGAAIRLEAESFSAESGGTVERIVRPGVDKQAIKLWDNDGHALEWKFSTPTAGRYYLVFRYANGGSGDVVRLITIDGKPLGGAEDGLQFPLTDGWGNAPAEWHQVVMARKEKPYIIALDAGDHVLKLTNSHGGGLNLDWMEFVPVDQ